MTWIISKPYENWTISEDSLEKLCGLVPQFCQVVQITTLYGQILWNSIIRGSGVTDLQGC